MSLEQAVYMMVCFTLFGIALGVHFTLRVWNREWRRSLRSSPSLPEKSDDRESVVVLGSWETPNRVFWWGISFWYPFFFTVFGLLTFVLLGYPSEYADLYWIVPVVSVTLSFVIAFLAGIRRVGQESS